MCDGKDTPEEMLKKAIELGFDSLGFSTHAKTVQRSKWELHTSVDEYVSEINRLKREYADRITVFLGAELDYFSKGVMPTDTLDYTIGSVHKVIKDGVKVDFDHSYESAKESIDTLYDGDSIAYSRDYYELVAKMAHEVDYDIVGHFDLLTKFSEKHPELIDTESKEYRSIALEALSAVREKHEIFEMNTGAIGRGYRTTPYPAPFILDEMRRLDCKLVLSSDCHNKDFLTVHFKEATEYARAHGFSELYYLTDGGFVGEKI